ncbi:trigger factor [Facklamia hominis]|uniref:trigger factor n=1 Tax=Facklamia hominis TaxID=178214 RepID=UPI000C7A2D72|nr:trigger factor [Facklamia hominis]PKY93729.1 trigger factor [Facklamia hominis]RYC97439.1 trigger factor [Facklamia hominis]WPJ89946.1 trigger factor [Facklamia hominis]
MTKFEKTNTNEGVLTFTIPAEKVQAELDRAFKKARKNISVPGFRKGKVPRQIFNNVYGEESLYQEVLNQLIPGAYQEAVEAEGLQVVAQPEMDIESLEKHKDWVMTAKVTLKPEVKLGDYKGLEVEKQDRDVTDEEVQARLELKQKQLAELVVKEGAAKLGDTVIIDFEGFLGDEAFEGGKGENHSLELGSNSFIPGFEDQLVDAKAGDDVEVKVTFPEDYHAENLKGKEATFKVKVHEVKSKEIPELDDEFAKDADDEVETLDEYKNKLRVQIKEEKEAQAAEFVEDQAVRKAVENAEIVELPQVMVDEEVQRQMDHFLNNLKRQGINEDLYYQISGTDRDGLRKNFEEEADLRTKTNLVLEKIVEEEAIEVSEAEIEEEVNKLAEQYNMDAKQVRQYVTEDMLTGDIKLKKALSLIVDSAKEK